MSSLPTPISPDLPSKRYAAAMEPLAIRSVRFRNRVFLSAMGLDMAEIDGRVSQELAGFYFDVIEGGVGGVILSNASVSKESALLPRALKLIEDRHEEALRPFLAEATRRGAVAGVQLQHYGGQGTTNLTRGRALLTPSGIGCKSVLKLDPRYKVREMTLEDIECVIGEFATAAKRASRAGARFVQLQASNGYLLSSFLSKGTNRRTDDYGGNQLKRARILVEVIGAVRAAVGPDVVLGTRIGINDYLGDEGLLPHELDEVVPLLEDAGTDLFEVSFCVADTFSKLSRNTPELRAEIAAQVKRFRSFATVPVGYAAFISGLAAGTALIEDGVVDFIAMARALLADNDLVSKEIAGREDEVHRCLWDGKCFRDKFDPRLQRVHCCVNPKYLRPA